MIKKISVDTIGSIQSLVLEKGHKIFIPEASLSHVFSQIADELCDDDDCKTQTDLQDLLQSIAMSVEPIERGGKKFYGLDKVYYFFDNWKKAFERKDPEYLIRGRGLIRPIVDIEEFICSNEYADYADVVRPTILRELKVLHRNPTYIEAVLGGSIGAGKNFFAEVSLWYDLFKLSCYENPQVEFGLAPGSSIVFILQSVTHDLAKKAILNPLREKIGACKFFQQNFMFDSKIKTELVFPKNISVIAVSSSETSVLSLNCLGGIVDEINFFASTRGSAMARLRGEEKGDKAMKLYTTMLRRMKSRFVERGGHLPGKLYLVSSANYPGDFTSTKAEEAKDDKTIYVFSIPQWDSHRLSDGTLDPKKYCGEMFKVYLGSEYEAARIIKDESELDDIPDNKIIEVPIEYKKDFRDSIDDALRDIAGVPRARKNRFIPSIDWITRAEKLFETITEGQDQLFVNHVGIDLSKYDEEHLKELVNKDYLKKILTTGFSEKFIKRQPSFTAHIDIGLTGDAAVIAVGRVIAMSKNSVFQPYAPRAEDFVVKEGVKAPIILIDGILRIVPTVEADIDIEKIQTILFMLIKLGIPLKWVTGDRYQSAQLLRNLSKLREVATGVISLDRTIGPYMNFKNSLRETRIAFPQHPILREELRNLELDRKRGTHGKVDHPGDGTIVGKDVADSVCGVAENLFLLRKTYTGSEKSEIDLEALLYGTEVLIEDNDAPPPKPRSEWDKTLDEYERLREDQKKQMTEIGRVKNQSELEKGTRRGRRGITRISHIRGRTI